MNADPAQFDDPNLALDRLTRRHRDEMRRQRGQNFLADGAVGAQHGDARAGPGWKAQDVAKVQIESHQAAALQPTNIVDDLVGPALQLFIADGLDVVAGVQKHLARSRAEVFVKLEPHASGSTGIST